MPTARDDTQFVDMQARLAFRDQVAHATPEQSPESLSEHLVELMQI